MRVDLVVGCVCWLYAKAAETGGAQVMYGWALDSLFGGSRVARGWGVGAGKVVACSCIFSQGVLPFKAAHLLPGSGPRYTPATTVTERKGNDVKCL